ncbi:DUF4436 family protein [Inquilinus sp. Marseille-Q2685]|uniref:DUF4436 family protein n=1 Tax=Inquilinus sp. Marseille-Q2685 TaxID=2866581 RepID=UPI001CE3CD0D|nr:DUF4436 family protein [Inquilinus sp. Marseille-Q2685]
MQDVSDKPAGDAAGGETPRARSASPSRRAVVLAVLLAGCAIAYILILARFDVSSAPAETEFGAPARDARVRLYVQPIEVDPVNDSVQMRISVTPDPALASATAATADHDFLIKIRRGKQIEHVQIGAGQPLPEVTFEFDLEDGNVRDYPLDRYGSAMTLAASERTPDGAEAPLPIRVTVWEGLLGYTVKAQQAAAQTAGDLQLQFAIRRTGAVSFFGIAIYGAIVVMALCALVIGSLVFIGTRRIEVTLAGALGAVIFALPALRGALPGIPPLGVRADILIFFWAEIGAIIAFCLFVAAWARRGPPP